MDLTQARQGTEKKHWFVMVHRNPTLIERQLIEVNSLRAQETAPVLEYFIPFMFLQHQEGTSKEEAESVNDQRVPDEALKNNATRSVLRNFVFIRTTEHDLRLLTYEDWNNYSPDRLRFYRSASGHAIVVPDKMMERFITMCLDQREKFEIHPHDEAVALGTEVVIRKGTFRNLKAHIVDVRHTASGVRFTLSLEFFGKTQDIRLPDFTSADVVFKDESDVVTNAHIVERMQETLLPIISRRVNRKETPESREDDARTLDQLYFYRHIQIDDVVQRAQYRALILLCATLRYDQEGKSLYNRQARQFLTEFPKDSPSDEALAARATLLLALYASTKDPLYRDEAKCLLREQLPNHPVLHRLLSLLRR